MSWEAAVGWFPLDLMRETVIRSQALLAGHQSTFPRTVMVRCKLAEEDVATLSCNPPRGEGLALLPSAWCGFHRQESDVEPKCSTSVILRSEKQAEFSIRIRVILLVGKQICC